jgi:hypothetical protein
MGRQAEAGCSVRVDSLAVRRKWVHFCFFGFSQDREERGFLLALNVLSWIEDMLSSIMGSSMIESGCAFKIDLPAFLQLGRIRDAALQSKTKRKGLTGFSNIVLL